MFFFSEEIPNEPVAVFQDDGDRIKVELNFNAEVSNVLIVNARALGDAELDPAVAFDMSGVSKNGKLRKLAKCCGWERGRLRLE